MSISTKIFFFLTLLFLYPVGVLHAQTETRGTVTASFRDTPYFEVFQTIQKQTGINFIYNVRDLEGLSNLTHRFTDEPVESAVGIILQSRRATLEYEITDNTVIIRPRARHNITLSGYIVSGEDREPLQWATVAVAGRPLGTQTNLDGMFSFTVPSDGNLSLQLSFVGYTPLEVNVSDIMKRIGEDNIRYDEYSNDLFMGTFVLRPVSADIARVVVTGMANRAEGSYAGATSHITQEQLKSTGAQNIFRGLQLLEPSLRIFDNMEMGSDPNTLPDIQLRGASKLDTGTTGADGLRGKYQYRPNQPLFILDGFETDMEIIFNMDMNRIESVTILKDASAKALYGSKAANGVIIIQTRMLGESGTIVTVNYDLSLEIPDLRSYNLASAAEKLQFEYDNGSVYYGDPAGIWSEGWLNYYNERKRLVDAGLDTYWLSKPLRTGVRHNVSATIEFGDNNLRNNVSFNLDKNDGVMKGSDRDLFGADITTLYNTRKFKFRNIARIGYTRSHDSPYGSFSDYTLLNPYHKAFDDSGNIMRKIPGLYYGAVMTNNPLYDATLPLRLSTNMIDISENLQFEWETPLPDLRITALGGITHQRYEDHRFYPGEHSLFEELDDTRKGSYDYETGQATTMTGAVMAVYSRTFGKHMIFATGRWDVGSKKYTNILTQVEGFPSLNMTSIIYGSHYKPESRPLGNSVTARNISVLGTVNYSFDNRYAVDFNVRRDAASVFSDNHKWTTSASAGLKWNLQHEAFMSSVTAVRTLALRASVGQTGNQNQGVNYSVYSYDPENWYMEHMPGAVVNMMENKSLLWEKKVDYNIGLIGEVAGLSFSLDYYVNLTSNMVIPLSVAPSIGFATFYQNLGQVRNNGIEATVSYDILNRRDYQLRGWVSVTTNRNRLRKLSEAMREFNTKQQEIAAQSESPAPVIMYVDGMDMNTIWAVRSYGIDPVSGREIFVDRNGNMTFQWDASDMVASGSSNPKVYGTGGLSASWKGLRLDVSMRFETGRKIYNETLIAKVEDAWLVNNLDRRAIYDRWQKPGDEARYGVIKMSGEAYTKATTRFVQDFTRISLASMQLSYEFDSKLLEKLRLKRLRLTLSSQNLCEYWSVGFERGTAYPFSRTFTMGINCTF